MRSGPNFVGRLAPGSPNRQLQTLCRLERGREASRSTRRTWREAPSATTCRCLSPAGRRRQRAVMAATATGRLDVVGRGFVDVGTPGVVSWHLEVVFLFTRNRVWRATDPNVPGNATAGYVAHPFEYVARSSHVHQCTHAHRYQMAACPASATTLQQASTLRTSAASCRPCGCASTAGRSPPNTHWRSSRRSTYAGWTRANV